MNEYIKVYVGLLLAISLLGAIIWANLYIRRNTAPEIEFYGADLPLVDSVVIKSLINN